MHSIFKKNVLKVFVVLFFGYIDCFFATAQTLPDSIVVFKNTYRTKRWADTVDGDSLYRVEKYIFVRGVSTLESNVNDVNDSVISDILNEINDPINRDTSLARFGIDTIWIKHNPNKLLEISTEAKQFAWNKPQEELIHKALVNISSYQKNLNSFFSDGCCYGIDVYFRYQFTIIFYRKSRIVNQLSSRKYSFGHRAPWFDDKGNKIYSFKIEGLIDTLIGNHRKSNAFLTGRPLLRKLVNEIVEQNSESLHQLAPNSYQKEINELSPLFTITSYTEMTGYGGYHGDGHLVAIDLHNSNMVQNLYIKFLASKVNGTIYSRDSVKKDYEDIIYRVQSIKFIIDYLKANPNDHLSILYFNNRAINQYNIDGVNKNPREWKNYEADVKRLEWYKQNNIKPSFDTVETLTTSRKLYCGCDYRFANNFITKAVMFLVEDEQRNSSRWFLLPDNTVLLYLMEGKKVLDHDYSEFGKYAGLQYPCVRFDLNGKIIPKNN